ncbi:TIGR04149 family rSAM-modified RiPP [Chryseobacterium sp. 'Rf worker isolate 10']|uniref:TIGR04149 family rSAM-modified RiPP n=1 Tax=Chryseobacterium sp. 'Rf worker isolate 10' TaxID=2887348 RepID=UPI003D6E9F2F
MKKLKLITLNLNHTEVLTREQLKNVLGGTGSGVNCGSNQHSYTCVTEWSWGSTQCGDGCAASNDAMTALAISTYETQGVWDQVHTLTCYQSGQPVPTGLCN